MPASGTVKVGQWFWFRPAVTAAPNRALAFSVANAPAWLSLDGFSGTLSGAPTSADVGTFANIQMSVSDGETTVAGTAFTVTVTSNVPPPGPTPTLTIAGNPSTTGVEGIAWSFRPSASDVAGKVLTFRAVNAPAWSQFDASTGTLAGTPPPHSAGTYANIVVAVSDGSSEAALPAFSLKINADRPPTLSGAPATSVSVAHLYSFRPASSDPSGRPLIFTVTGRPAWANFNATNGMLSGTPAAGNVGMSGPISISVTDGVYSASLPAFTITVGQPSAGTAKLSWVIPTTRSDGSALTNLAAFRIYWGTAPGNYNNNITINNATTASYTVTSLPGGATYYFVTTAVDSNGIESNYSNVAVKAL